MNLVFADSFYFLALLSPGDRAHAAADAFPLQNYERMITTRWVLAEVADALSAPAVRGSFLELLSQLRGDQGVSILSNDDLLFDRGVALYSRRKDKNWPLTDCISFVVMRERGIKDALTGDRHFEQAGFNPLLK